MTRYSSIFPTNVAPYPLQQTTEPMFRIRPVRPSFVTQTVDEYLETIESEEMNRDFIELVEKIRRFDNTLCIMMEFVKLYLTKINLFFFLFTK